VLKVAKFPYLGLFLQCGRLLDEERFARTQFEDGVGYEKSSGVIVQESCKAGNNCDVLRISTRECQRVGITA